MSINFPNSIDSLTNPTSSNPLASPSHALQHANANDAIEAIEAKVGANSSAVTTSHDYKLSGVATGDKAVSKTGTETLSGKTLTAPQINMGSDAIGDMYYRNGGGITTRLPAGADGTIISYASGLPTVIANPAVSDASYTVKGAVKGLTDAATSGLTITAGVISVNSGTSANNIVKLDGSSKLPAVDGSALTNIKFPFTAYTAGDYKIMFDTRVMSSAVATGTYTKIREAKIARGGVVRLSCDWQASSGSGGAGAQIRFYVNGTAVGTASAVIFQPYQTFTQDITVADGDLIQVYGASTALGQDTKNFFVAVSAPAVIGYL